MSEPGAPTAPWLTARALALVVGLVTLVAFLGVRNNGFVHLDDPYYLTRNPWIGLGLTRETVLYALTSRDVWNWHPLTWWSHLLDVELFGLAPAGHHLMSAALHACTAAGVFLVAHAALRRRGAALFVALAFALHPQRVESVAWASERKDLLCALFFVLCALVHLRGAEEHTQGRIGRALLCALALMAKPMAVTLPCVLLLLDAWPRGRVQDVRDLARAVLRKTELFVLAGAASALTLWAQARQRPDSGPLLERVTDAGAAVVLYVVEMAAPFALSHSHPRVDERPALALGVMAGAAVLCTLLVAMVRLARRTDDDDRAAAAAVGVLWFVGVLVPVLGLVRVGGELFSDRYSYLPSVGLLFVVVAGADALTRRVPYIARVVPLVAAALVVLWAALTVRHIPVWQSAETLMQHALAVGTHNAVVRHHMARALTQRGDKAGALALLEEAEAIRPDAQSADLVGQALLALGRRDDARAAFERASARDAGFALAVLHRAELLADDGDDARAETLLREAVRLERSRRHLGALVDFLAERGRTEEAGPLRAEALALPVDGLHTGPAGAFADPWPGQRGPQVSAAGG